MKVQAFFAMEILGVMQCGSSTASQLVSSLTSWMAALRRA